MGDESINAAETLINIDKEFIEKLLRSSENDNTVEVIDFKTKPLMKKGENYNSVIIGIEATTKSARNNYEIVIYNLVAKVAPADEGRLMFMKMMKLFPKEAHVYNVIIPELINMQKKRGITDVVVPSAPKLYTPKDCEEMVLVFENLCSAGYLMADKLVGLNLKQCKLVLCELARFHAISYAYIQELKPVTIQDKYPLLNDIWTMEEFETQGGVFMEKSLSMCADVLKLVKENNKYLQLAEKLEKFNENIYAKSAKIQKRQDGVVVFNHGDCWVNNFMFKYSESNEPIDVKFLDWQIIRCVDCCGDLNYFVYTSTTSELRHQHLEELLQLYHTTFLDTLKFLDEKEPPKFTFEDFKNQFHSFKIIGLINACMLLPLMMARPDETMDMEGLDTTDEVKIAEITSERLEKSMGKMKENDHFMTRLVGVLTDMEQDGIL